MDLVIEGGRIVDGTGKASYTGDIAVSNGKIVEVGVIHGGVERRIDAKGLVVAPGFIDSHSHSDLMLIAEPEAKQKIMQGITTEIVGQDGLGEAPIKEKDIENWRSYLSGLNGDPEIDWSWRSLGEYLDAIEEAGPATNVASLVGHGNLRLSAMGMDDRPPTDSELEEMKALLRDSLRQGAYGLSTGMIYPPCVYAATEELTELCRVVSEEDGIFVIHMRNEGDALLESIGEVATIGANSGVKLHISHFKAAGKRNWGRSVQGLEAIKKAREVGLSITVDQYPYTAGSTFLSARLPSWMHEGGVNAMLDRLRDSATRGRAYAEMTEDRSFAMWGDTIVTSVKTEGNKHLEGRSLAEIAEMRGVDIVEALFELVLEERNAVGMVSFSMSEEDVRIIMGSPIQMFCTDGIVLGKPHPRAYGSFPRVLGRYVREGVLSLEEAVRKMTSLPAERFGLQGRGILKPGAHADITILNPETVIDTGTYEDPIRFPEGIEYVIVNGRVTVDSGAHTGERAGMVLRKGF
ncbi:amidohydrolase family protein [archaeon]|nr:amidohydrolase family protein [archaeon]